MPKLWVELVREQPHGQWDDRENERPLRIGWTPGGQMISTKEAVEEMHRAFDAGDVIVIVENCDLAREILHGFRVCAEVVAQMAEVAAPQSGDRIMEAMIDCWTPEQDGRPAQATLDWRIVTIKALDEALTDSAEDQEIASAALREAFPRGDVDPYDDRDQT